MRITAFGVASCCLLSLAFVLTGCAASESTVSETGGAPPVTDEEKPSSTCRALTEVCDNLDNDCDGQVDEGFDTDGDGLSSCTGDCNDNSASVFPGAPELKNGSDDNCDGKADNDIPGEDFDLDGTPFPADCNDAEPLVGPLAIEVVGDKTDNDCNGQIDEAPVDCEASGTTPMNAIGLCENQWLPNSVADGTMNPDGSAPMNTTAVKFPNGQTFVPQKGTWLVGSVDSQSVLPAFGTKWKPSHGDRLLMLSTGLARDNSPGSGNEYKPQRGTAFSGPLASQVHPLGLSLSCAVTTKTTTVNDLSELRLRIRVPQNAKSFRFNFAFFSAEYPEYVGQVFNDRFVALLESKSFTGNISFDKKGKDVSVNTGFFDVCEGDGCSQPVSLLAQTGYELPEGLFSSRPIGGGTGWLSTVAPVTPGEIIQLRLAVFDECDSVYDSAVLIDGFQWETEAVKAPETDVAVLQ